MGVLKKCWHMLTQDVDDDNESKKRIILLRIQALVMCLYFLAQAGVFLWRSDAELSIIAFALLLAHAAALNMTYHNLGRTVQRYLLFLSWGWIIFYVVMLGWDLGAQHFVFVLLIFACITSHDSVHYKVLEATILCATRIILYFYTDYHAPIVLITGNYGAVFQILNTVTIFISATALILVFSQNSLEMEKKLIQYNERLKEMSSRDSLTGLYNRRRMKEKLQEVVTKQEKKGKFISIAIGDIDFFKKVNDTYGHEAGDAVLKVLADFMDRYMKENGFVGRWGGEEFLFVFTHMNADYAQEKLDALRRSISKIEVPYENTVIRVTMTFGLEEHTYTHDVERTINEADKKLYQGKEKGRNCVVY